MDNWQAIASSATFISVILLIMTERLHLTIAAFLGALILIFCNVLTLADAVGYIGQSHQTLALFFGVMILVRSFQPTKVFDYLAAKIVTFSQGRGNYLLLGIVGITTPICAFLPNATTVMILAPLIPPIAQEIGVDFVPLLLLMVFIANSAGLLTLVGDPATYIVGDAINIGFVEYLERLSLGGIVAVLTVVFMLPWLFPKTWNTRLNPEEMRHIPTPTIHHPRALAAGGVIMLFVLIFFVIGESLPLPVAPATVALLGAALSLLLAHHSGIESINQILKDVDWSTLLFFMSTFVLIGALEKTGVIEALSGILALFLGRNIALGSLMLLFCVGFLSSVVPNIPLVVAMVPLLKGYLVQTDLASPTILDMGTSAQLPTEVLPLFYAMMLGATLGGNGTLVGASSNIVASGISELYGRPIPFRAFLRYGIPVALLQLFTSSLFLTFRFLL